MEIRDEDHEWSADDLSKIVKDMFARNLEACFELEDQKWEKARLTALKSQGKLLSGQVIKDQGEIENA